MFLCLGLLWAGEAAARPGGLPPPVLKALHAAAVPPTHVAVVVQELGSTRPANSVNAEVSMNPASLMKLVTTFAALELLGPAFRWRTEVYAAGTQVGEALHGPLILKGQGDPKLTLEAFWLLLRNLRERGLRDLEGDLVLDRSYFETLPHDPGEFDAEPLRPYNVGPDALLINFKAIRFEFIPEPARRAVRVSAEPRPAGLEIVNSLRLADGSCGDWRDRLRADFQPAETGFLARFTGSLAESCGEKRWNVALFSHPGYVGGVFRELWEGLGGAWRGQVQDGAVPADARLVYAHESQPLAELVRDINKFSNNVMARQLYLTLAAEKAGPPGRVEVASQVVRAWLTSKGLYFPELVIENGSGLSRHERLSAGNLARLLVAAWQSPVMPEMVASLPLAAMDGTLRKRLHHDPVAGQAHVKTGSLSDVRAIGGYVLDRAGRRHAVVMIVNHPNAGRTQPALEALLRWVYERGGA
jgi:serine-type D-Ala-D-Ala carboxypeptidase/endopeptidase (penicillin-binding protein 4)